MRVVAVYSTKGGVGKTTTAVNLAWEASRQHRVLLWDLDPQGAATFLLQVKPKLKGGVEALVGGKARVDRLVRETGYERLEVLPADDSYRELELALDAAKNSVERIGRVLKGVADDYDVVILDCPPGASLVAENALASADVVVLPLIPAPLSLRSLEQVRRIVKDSGRRIPILAVLSLVDRRKLVHRDAVETLTHDEKDVLDLVIPATVVIERMGAERAPVGVYAASSDAARVFRALWEKVAGAAKVKPAAPKKGHGKR